MTPAGTSNELDVQNEWEENTPTLRSTSYKYESDKNIVNILVGETCVKIVCPKEKQRTPMFLNIIILILFVCMYMIL